MSAILIRCDSCSCETSEFESDYDGLHFCLRCYAAGQIERVKTELGENNRRIEILEENGDKIKEKLRVMESKLEEMT